MEVCPVFIDETGVLSGSPQDQPVFGIGALVIPDTKSITDSLYRLHFNFSKERMTERRRIYNNISSRSTPPTSAEVARLLQSTRHHEYKFTKIRKTNVQQYIDLVNLYFSFQQPQFFAVMMDRLAPTYSLARWHNDAWSAYAHITRDLLQRQLDRDVFAILDFQGKPNNSVVHLEDVLCSSSMVKGCLRANSDISVYLQLVDVLLGCVQFDWRDAMQHYTSHNRIAVAKRDVVNVVKSRLGLRPEERILPPGVSLRSWRTPSLFTVSRGDW